MYKKTKRHTHTHTNLNYKRTFHNEKKNMKNLISRWRIKKKKKEKRKDNYINLNVFEVNKILQKENEI